MGSVVIRATNVGKRYRLGVNRSDTLRDQLAESVRRMLSVREVGDEAPREFWALRDVSFTIREGEVVGLIGRNGAGKSTILKILSRITLPTSGEIELSGRVGSLLEVGTGFHPELTGRENIYFNGSILGMTHRDVRRRFDEIVEFADVAQFLDTPVKRYSSGMYVRLAFAVAAHLEPDILLVDEVLAVGDTAFQRKCLGKMGEVASQGRTVVFVSHNMAAVQALCTRGIVFAAGGVQADTGVREAVASYLSTIEERAHEDLAERVDRTGAGQVRLVKVEAAGGSAGEPGPLMTGRPAWFTFHIAPRRPGVSCTFTLYDQHGAPVVNFMSGLHGPVDDPSTDQTDALVCQIDELLLLPGRYRMNASLTWNGEHQDHLEGVTTIDVESGDVRGRPVSNDGRYGSMTMPHRWGVASNGNVDDVASAGFHFSSAVTPTRSE